MDHLPYILVWNVGKLLFALIKILIRRQKRCVVGNAVPLTQGKTKQSYQPDSARQRFADALHHLKLLRATHEKLPFFMLPVYKHLDLRKQFRCLLDFINKYRRRVVFEKGAALLLCCRTDDRIVESCIVHPFRNALKHGGFSDLPRAGNKDRTKHFGKRIHRCFCVPFDIFHKAPPFG